MSSTKKQKTIARTSLVIRAQGPLLPGSVSPANSQCGKPNCACKADPPKLHGPYYRWTGFIAGKRTTQTISQPQAEECQRRIKNYHALQLQLDHILEEALTQAPWNTSQ
jgi:hypothetical protein